jgi:hypothetical protein
MKCILCNQRKAKRFCPAKDRSICTQCCGGKRVLEVDCPESCPYLQSGRLHDVHQHSAYYSSDDPIKQRKHRRALTDFEDFVTRIEYILGQERLQSRDLKDAEAAAAIDLLLENLRTEGNGILYERSSNDLRVDLLRRRLADAVQSARSPQQQGAQRDRLVETASEKTMALKDAIETLEIIREVLQKHVDAGPGALGYVDFLARLLPRRGRVDNDRSPLIIPGR